MVIQGFYEHIKTGKRYFVFGVGKFSSPPKDSFLVNMARDSEDDTLTQKVEVYAHTGRFVLSRNEFTGNMPDVEYVIYQALYDNSEVGDKQLWVRPRTEGDGAWEAEKMIAGKMQKRFRLIQRFHTRTGL